MRVALSASVTGLLCRLVPCLLLPPAAVVIAIAACACTTDQKAAMDGNPSSPTRAASGHTTSSAGSGFASTSVMAGTRGMARPVADSGAAGADTSQAGMGGASAADAGNATVAGSGSSQDAGTTADAATSNPASCPATYAALEAARSPCASSVGCAYPEGYCTCYGACGGVKPDPNEPTPASSWACSPPREGCPVGLPAAGTACADEGHTCLFGSCCVQLVTCRSGLWTVGALMCPP
jgi:hypothetical protein